MAFDLNAAGSYGSGKLGDVTDPDKSTVNAYAYVEDINTYDFLAIPFHNSDFVAWRSDECVGCQVMLHAIACKSGSTGHSLCGRYLIATITGAELESQYSLRVTIDKSTAAFASGKNYYFWQAILIPEFKNLTLNSSYDLKPLGAGIEETSWPDGESITAPIGGVVVFKCSDTLTLNGGHIHLRGLGFDTDISTAYRPNASHETNGKLDTDLYSGAENSIAKDKLLLNCGDGACLIMAKTINCSSGSSRIGNPDTYGVQYCRGASDSTGTPSGFSNIGGSTIAIVTHQFTNFSPSLIAKYHSGSDGRGLARAYLAVLNAHNSPKPDEGLYALDTICRPERVKSMCNISGFGNGQDGSYNLASDANKCWNSYARVTAVSGRVFTISRIAVDVEEFTDFAVGRLVLIHQSRKASAADWQDGRFYLSRITALSGNTVTIKHNFSFNLSTYNVQMVVVPEFQNLTLPTVYNTTPHYKNGAGGIFAIAVNGTCNLSGGKINMESKGTFNGVVNPIISNYQMKGALPLGQGHGSVFILARNLTMDTSTRIGATYDGSKFGGDAVKSFSGGSSYPRTAQGGWKGLDGSCTKYPEDAGTGGSGGAAGSCSYNSKVDGGWHSNAASSDPEYPHGCQGAHIFIVADSITGFNLSALSTGGAGGANLSIASTSSIAAKKGGDGGAGYGGGGFSITNGTTVYRFGGAGGYHGGGATAHPASDVDYAGGGAAGAAFVYANNINNQSTSGLILS